MKHTTRPIPFLHCFLAFRCESFILLTQAYFRSSLPYFLSWEGGGRGGGVSTPFYKPYRYVPPQRVGFSRLFGLKTGIDFAPFWYGIGYGFRGNYRSVPNEYKVRKRNMLIRNGF